MHRSSAFAIALLSSLPLTAIASPAQQVVPADSFIVQHIDSVNQLQQQVTLDPVVRRRLARHFHTSAPAVVRYIQDNLVLKKITVARRYQVYCIGRGGQEYTINSRLAVGTPVFVMRTTGKPILKLACGNPMVAALPTVVAKVSPYQSPALASLPKPGSVQVASALASNGPVVVAMNDGPGVVVMPTTRVAGFIGQLPIVHGGGFPFGYLAGIPILATLVGHHSGNSTGSTGTTTGTGTDTTGTGTGTTTGTGTGTDSTTGTGTTGTTGTGTTDTGTTGTTTDTGTTTGTGTTGTGTDSTTGTGTTGIDTTGNSTTGTDTTGTGTIGTDSTGTGTTGNNSGNTGVTPVPEPSTPAAFAVGGLGLLFLLSGAKRRNRRKAREN